MTSKKKYYLLILVVAAALIVTLFVYRNKEKYISTTIAISDTILNITAQTTEKKMYDLVASITNEINRMDNILNPYNENSEIAIINKKSLENKGILTLQNVDQSSGGRCPGRYTFSKEHFQILSVFVDEGTVDLMLFGRNIGMFGSLYVLIYY